MTIPCHHVRSGKPSSRTGLTLTELMVSVTIMVVLVAAAVPILRPLNASTKNREAARQIQALFAEARGMAALRGRPVGVMFDTSLDPKVATDVQDRDAVTRLYLAEIPPLFQGTSEGSCAVVTDPQGAPYNDPTDVLQAYNVGTGNYRSPVSPYAYLTFYSSPANYLAVRTYPGTGPKPDIDRTLETLIGTNTAFRIRFNGTGPWYVAFRDPGTRFVQTGIDPSERFRLEVAGVTSVDRLPLPVVGVVRKSHRIYTDSSGFPFTIGSPIRPQTMQPLKYQIQLPPQRVGTSALELPGGAVIDLRCSGFGRSEYGLGDSLPLPDPSMAAPASARVENPVLLFSPNGSVDAFSIFSGFRPNAPTHLLVGTRKNMAKLDQPALINGLRVTDFTTGTLTRDSAYGNLRDGSSVWVTINNRTGAAATSDIGVIAPAPLLSLQGDREFNPTGDPNGAPLNAELVRRNAIESAREFANELNSKGGL